MESKIDPLDKEYFTIETAREMTQPTDRFICEPDDNTFGIKFIRFRIRDMDSGETIADIQHPQDDDFDENYLTEAERVIHYNFGPRFLELKTIGTLLDFKIGDKPVKNLVLIERHYFKDKLIEGEGGMQSFEFKINFCIPGTENTWEMIYDVPEINEDLKNEMIDSPYDTKSDTFIFVDGKLIIHKRAIYDFSPQY